MSNQNNDGFFDELEIREQYLKSSDPACIHIKQLEQQLKSQKETIERLCDALGEAAFHFEDFDHPNKAAYCRDLIKEIND